MSPFFTFHCARASSLLPPRFRVTTENQPHRHLVAVRQLQNYVRDLSWIAFRTSFESSQNLVHCTDRGLVLRQQVRHILTRALCPVGPNAARLECADLDPERREF